MDGSKEIAVLQFDAVDCPGRQLDRRVHDVAIDWRRSWIGGIGHGQIVRLDDDIGKRPTNTVLTQMLNG